MVPPSKIAAATCKCMMEADITCSVLPTLSSISMWCCRYHGTPIMDAVRHKHSEVVAFLKRNGAVLHHDQAKGLLLHFPHWHLCCRYTAHVCLGLFSTDASCQLHLQQSTLHTSGLQPSGLFAPEAPLIPSHVWVLKSPSFAPCYYW